MGYNAQLVVRSRDPEGTSIIEQVKELAGEEGKTFSEMALELLERGLAPEAPSTTAAPVAKAPAAKSPVAKSPVAKSPVAKSPVAKSQAEPEPAPKPEPQPTPDPVAEPDPEPAPAPEPEPVSEPEPDSEPVAIGDHDSVDDVAKACLAQLEKKGAQSAARLLAHFFATAGPVDGGKVKNLLKDQLTKAEYDVILSKLRDTKEYRNYRQRVIFER